jgi:SPP1 family predicted phage head-tail adaptor
MLFRDVLELPITITKGINSIGNTLESKAYRQIYADKQSIRQSEFYQAAATGLKPELMLVIRSAEYNNEEIIRYNGKEYRIIRTYDKGNDFLELVCGGITGSEVKS